MHQYLNAIFWHDIVMHRRIVELFNLLRAIPRVISFYQGSTSMAVRRTFRVWRREGIGGIQRRASILLGALSSKSGSHLSAIDLYGDLPVANADFNPKVSIIVPNYNHAPYLRQRLESIYQQTYQNIEVILLDDHSSDSSLEILKEFAKLFPDRTICKFNDSNSGSVFRQWKNGFKVATGELIWLAESDDFCSENFLAEQVRAFQNPAITLSFCKTEFVAGDPPEKVWTLNEYLSDLGIADWDRSFIRSAHSLVCAGWAVKNIVPNVSGAIFRHPRNLPLLHDPLWLDLRMCGDWIFYLSIIRGGLVAYSPFATNYYRQHDRSTSQTNQKNDLYYAEHEVVAYYLVELFNVDRSTLDKQNTALYHHWCCSRGSSVGAEFNRLYNPNRAWLKASRRQPNLVMAVYALISGGGETFPIILANLLYERGFAVTLLNCSERITEPGVLAILDPRIPRLELSRLELAGEVFSDMGIEFVHSHHAWVDLSLAALLIGKLDIKQIITMHGMYEMMTSSQLNELIPLLSLRVNHFVYTAEKNLAAFPESFRKTKNFSRIRNSLPLTPISPIDRTMLALGQDDFVLCMVARGIPEKGWEEAIQAVNWANGQSAHNIHLLLIGDGAEPDRLSDISRSKNIHFLGFRSNIRDYFAASDIGFLPSRFKGESAPLVVIDCLLAGKPFLASDIGEIRSMLDTPEGLAGKLFPLHDWTLDSEAIGRVILELANQPSCYKSIQSRVASASYKFDVTAMVDSYQEVYRASSDILN